ncbi:MAG: carbohydrate-binding protein, partial [Bacteroidaceae bacterium]|nr:carbohydrate-binding protein [Bacteroidaceae bacterium]
DRDANRLQRYRIEVQQGGSWNAVFEGAAPTTERVKIHRFPTLWASHVRLTVLESRGTASIAEVGVYCEER